MVLGVLDITPLTALQSHLCSLHFSRMTAPQAEQAVWLLSLFLSLCLTDFFLLYFLNIKKKNLHLRWSVSAEFDFVQGCSYARYT